MDGQNNLFNPSFLDYCRRYVRSYVLEFLSFSIQLIGVYTYPILCSFPQKTGSFPAIEQQHYGNKDKIYKRKYIKKDDSSVMVCLIYLLFPSLENTHFCIYTQFRCCRWMLRLRLFVQIARYIMLQSGIFVRLLTSLL